MKKQGLYPKSVELWFHIMIWCHSKRCHPKMVSPGAGPPSISDATATGQKRLRTTALAISNEQQW